MIKTVFLLATTFIFHRAVAQVTWQKMPGPNEPVTSITVSAANTVYASTVTYGIFRSADQGSTWNNISAGLPDSAGTAVEIATDDKVFAATGSHGVWQYTGAAWNTLNNGLPVSNISVTSFARTAGGNMYMMAGTGKIYFWNGTIWTDITFNFPALGRAIAVGPAGVLYAGAFNAGVYKFDGISNWTLLGAAMPNIFVTKIAVSSADTVFAACNSNNIFRCPAAGGSWTAINTGLPALNINFIGTDIQNRLYIGESVSNGTIYRSINSGDSWTLASANIFTTNCYSFASSPAGKVYVGASGIFSSSDGGIAWSDLNPGMDARRAVTCFDAAHGGTLFIGTKVGPWRSIDKGVTWQLRNTGITHLTTLQIMDDAAGDILCHGVNSIPKGAIYRSLNNGDTWTQVAANGADQYTKLKQHKADTIWASSRFSGATSLSYSLNNGATWINNPLSISAIWDIDFSNDATIFLGSESEGVSRSDNGGQTFTLGVGNTIPWYGNVIEIETDVNGVIFAGGDWWQNILWFSKPEENGNNWTKFTDPDLVISGMQDLIFDQHNNAYIAAENGGVRMAYNNNWNAATDWLQSSTGLPGSNADVLELGFDTTGYIYAVCYNNSGHEAGLFRSSIPVNPPLSETYTFTGNGNWDQPANWQNNKVPPAILNGNAVVIIDPVTGGECVVNVNEHIQNGATLKVVRNKKLRITGDLFVNP